MMGTMKHKFSVEKLHHFQCGGCRQWWTIGDFKKEGNALLYCPRCGALGLVEELKQ